MPSATPDMEAAVPLIQKVSPLPIPPFLLNDEIIDNLAEAAPLDKVAANPLPPWAFARKTPAGNRLPQSIAHRGYKAEHPENTMGAFKGAVEVGAHALETDIHLTKDDVVVLSHDANLKRCFGKEEKIIDCTWEYVAQQRTLREPHEQMPTLRQLLEYLSSPALDHIWVLLDIKLDMEAEKIMRLIAETIASTPPSPSKPWNQRIVLGCWAAKFFPFCAQYLPTFSTSFIGFSIPYARQFLKVPDMSFNMLQKSLVVPYIGPGFIRDAKKKNRSVYTWTVNEERMMKWSIREELDGVITDDPKRFLEVCDEWEKGNREVRFTVRDFVMIVWIQFMVIVFGILFWWKFGAVAATADKKRDRNVKKKEAVAAEPGTTKVA